MSKSDLDIMINLLADTKGFSQQYKNALTQQVALNREMNRGQAAATKAAAGYNVVERQTRTLGVSLRSAAGYASGFFGVLAAQNAAVDIKDTLADYQQFSTRLKFLSSDSRDYAVSMAFLNDLADKHGKSVLDLGESYTDLAALRKGDVINMQQQQALMTGLSNAQSALGASTGQLGNLMYGLGQALSQPNVQAQEFNQVVEPLPGLMQALTRAAGLQGKTYRDLVLDGKVTSAMFRDDLIKALGEYDGAAQANIDNIKAQENAVKNLHVQTVAAFEAPIENTYGAMLDASAASLRFLRNNAEEVTDALAALTAFGLIRGTAALVNYTAASVAKRNASVAAAAADVRQAEANVALARTQAGVAGLYATTTAAATQLTVAKNALTAAQARYNAVALTGTRVARGLWAAMGGIPGLILLGAYSIYEFASSADDASAKTGDLTKNTRDLAQEVENLTKKYQSLTNQGRQIEIDRLTQQETAARAKLLDAQRKLDELDTPAARLANKSLFGQDQEKNFNAQILKLKKQSRDASTEIQRIAELKSTLFESNLPEGNWVNALQQGISSVSEETQKLLDKLQKQTALYGTMGEAAGVAYEVTYGALKDISAEEKAQLILAASKLDAKKQEIDANRSLQSEVDKMLEKQREEIVLFGDTSREAKVRYEIEYGALQNINDALKQKLILQAKDLDNQQKAQALKSRVEQIALAQFDPTQRENKTYQDNLTALGDYKDSLPGTDLTERQRVNQLIEAEHLRHNKALEEISRNSQSQISAMWDETFDRFAAGVGQATASALFDSNSLGEGLKNVLRNVGKQALGTLIEIGIKQAGLWLAEKAFRAADTAQRKTLETGAQAASIATGTATASALAAAWSPAAAFASLATVGGNAVPAMAGISSTFALAESLQFAGLFDNGGRIPGGSFGIAGEYGPEIVRGPAYVTSRRDTAQMFNQRAANDGAQSITLIDNSTYNIQGNNADDVITQLKPVLKQHKADTLAEVGKQFKTGRGVVYDGYRSGASR